ncbi:MAG: OB-fold domain-containing protein [Actinomycetota bacterium]
MAEPLIAKHVLEFAYTRSLGPTLTTFFTGLRDKKVFGSKTAGGRVIVPPTPHDPETGEVVSELVEVSDAGVVTTWAWVSNPRPKHPLDKPFAWALVQLDGADTAMLHAVDAGKESKMATGMRVRARWADETVGYMTDIECFEPATPERSVAE